MWELLKDTYIINLPYGEYPSSEQITLARLSSTTELPYPQILLQVPLIQTRTLPWRLETPEYRPISPSVHGTIIKIKNNYI